jgi:hypothetical protein
MTDAGKSSDAEDPIGSEISEICARTLQQPDADGRILRAVHRRAIAVLKAEITLPGGLAPEVAFGLFAEPGTYQAWMRFSSALFENERDPDSRGMAIKLLNVPGETCDPAVPGVQDFIAHNQNGILFDDADAALDYFREIDGCPALTKYNAMPPRFTFPGLNPLRTRWGSLGQLIDTVKQQVTKSCLTEMTYFSGTPYRLGDDAMKFSFKPVPGPKVRRSGSFRNRIKQRLEGGPIRFEFRLQRRTRPESESLERATRPWKSPYVTVGTLAIEPQDFDTPERDAFGEALVFSPWNCLKAHEPLGSLNAVRRRVYRDSAMRRGALDASQ